MSVDLCGPLYEGEDAKCKTGVCCTDPTSKYGYGFCFESCRGKTTKELEEYSANGSGGSTAEPGSSDKKTITVGGIVPAIAVLAGVGVLLWLASREGVL